GVEAVEVVEDGAVEPGPHRVVDAQLLGELSVDVRAVPAADLPRAVLGGGEVPRRHAVARGDRVVEVGEVEGGGAGVGVEGAQGGAEVGQVAGGAHGLRAVDLPRDHRVHHDGDHREEGDRHQQLHQGEAAACSGVCL